MRHSPVYREYDGAEKTAVFIHGFMSGPGHFSELAEAVYESGCSCLSVLLPGHGGTFRQFVKSNAGEWERHVQNEIGKIRDKYKEMYLVGHSMGGLLALNASLLEENKISGVFLISTPLKINLLSPKAFLFRVRLVRLSKDHEIKSAYIKSSGVSAYSPFSLPLIVKPVINFYRVVRKTRKNLPKVSVPVYMFHSRNDETTSYKSAKLFYDGLCNTERYTFPLSESRHSYYCEDEREIIMKKLIDVIKASQIIPVGHK